MRGPVKGTQEAHADLGQMRVVEAPHWVAQEEIRARQTPLLDLGAQVFTGLPERLKDADAPLRRGEEVKCDGARGVEQDVVDWAANFIRQVEEEEQLTMFDRVWIWLAVLGVPYDGRRVGSIILANCAWEAWCSCIPRQLKVVVPEVDRETQRAVNQQGVLLRRLGRLPD